MEIPGIQVLRRPALRRLGRSTVIFLAIALVVLVGAGVLVAERLIGQTSAPAIPGQVVPVRRGNLQATVQATGTVVSTRQARLAFTTSGRLKEVLVKIGDSVKAGQELARLDLAPLDLKLEQARSNLKLSQLKLEQLKTGSRPEQVAAARAAYESALARYNQLKAGPTAEDLKQAQSAVDSALANLKSARAKLEQLQAGPTEADIKAAEQAVAQARATLQKAESDLAKLRSGPSPDDIRAAELAVEQARNNLYAAQVERDATCGRDRGAACQAANGRVFAAETAVSQAQAKLEALRRGPDPRDIAAAEAAVQSARETLASAEARLNQVKSGPTPADLQAAQSAVEAAEANYRSALAKLEQVKAGPTAADLAAAEANLKQAQAQLAQATGASPQDLAIAEEQVRQAELAVQQAELERAGAILVAPFDGVVGTISANLGEQVGPGTTILTLVDPSAVRVDVTVDETDVAKVAPDQRALISFDALPDQAFRGRVIGVAPNATIQQGVATYTVAIGFENLSRPLPVGLTANAQIVIAERTDTLLVPSRAVRRQGRQQFVDVVVDGKIETRPVRTGLSNDQFTEILEGLREGENVLIPTTTTVQPRFGASPGGFPAAPKPGGAPAVPKAAPKPGS
jgi:HlyD family secretion protein